MSEENTIEKKTSSENYSFRWQRQLTGNFVFLLFALTQQWNTTEQVVIQFSATIMQT